MLPLLLASHFLFVYFEGRGASGVYYALSRDGYQWAPLNGGQPWLKPEHPGELMRDPFVARGPDGVFHMVWTWEWNTPRLGYASSPDLVRWSAQREIPVMPGVAGVRNVWAPEVYWDRRNSRWMLIWSTTIEGRFPETLGTVLSGGNHRIYSMTTRDFREFSEPRLFFDPGYPVIDATILEAKGRFYLIFKDERDKPLRKQMLIASGPTIEGPWSDLAGPFTENWTEGPSALRVGRDYLVYFDHYRAPLHYGAARSRDLKNWTIVSPRMKFPPGAKHGGFLRLTSREAARLRSARLP
jgi:hypothetical protein